MKLFSALSLALFSTALVAGTPDEYNIRITVKGLKPGNMTQLARYYGDKQYIMDSASVNENGEIVFKGTEKWPQGIYMFVNPSPTAKNKYFDFVMDAGQNFSLEADTADFIKTMKVKGSDENKFFYEYQNFMATKQKQILPLQDQYKRLKDKNKDSAKIVQDKMAEIDREVKAYKENFVKSNPQTFVAKLFKGMEEPEIPEAPVLANGKKDTTFAYHYYKTHFFDNFDLTDDRLLRSPIFHNKIKQYMERLTPQIPDSISVSADYLIEKARPSQEVFKYLVYWLTYTYESSKIMGMDAVFVHMVDQYYVTKQAFWVDSTQQYKITKRGMELKPLLLGKKAPAIIMPDSTGKMVSLYDVKARYTVVVFWDHDCSHCKKEIPRLLEAYNTKLKAKGVQVYAVETEDKPKEWKKFVRENKLNWINVQELDDYKRAVTKKIYDIYSTPVIYLLDENKIIRAKRVDSEQLDGIVDALEKEKAAKK